MISLTRALVATLLIAWTCTSASVSAQSLAEASAAAKKAPHAWPLSPNTGEPAKVYAIGDADSERPREPDVFTPTADNVFVCKSRSLKALYAVVSREHQGYYTSQFATYKLRDNPDLATAATADADSCETGAYIGAMEKALKAAAIESARLQALLKRIY